MATKRKKTTAKKTGEIGLSKPIRRKSSPAPRPSAERGTIPFEKIDAALKEVLAARGALKKH
jgi:hypothetical protein